MKGRLVRCSAWLVAALFAAPAVAWSQDSLPPKRVLMLYGHDPKAPGVVAFTNALHAIVQAESPTRVVFYDELLDFERFPDNVRREELVNYIVEKYRGFKFRRHPDGGIAGPAVRYEAGERWLPGRPHRVRPRVRAGARLSLRCQRT